MKKLFLNGLAVLIFYSTFGCSKLPEELCTRVGLGCPKAAQAYTYTHTHALNYAVPVKKFNSCSEIKSFLKTKSTNGAYYGTR